MSTALRRLAHQENGHLAGRAYCDFRSFVVTGLMSEDDIARRLIASTRGSTITEVEAMAAVQKGIGAAKGLRN